MSIRTLKAEIADLPVEARRELMGYIAGLNRKNNEEFLRKLGEKIQNQAPGRWISIDEVEERLVK